MLSVLVFDSTAADPACKLAPITDLRAVFDIRTGALTTLERLTLHARLNDLPRPDGLLVDPSLAALVREAHPKTPVNDRSNLSSSVLLVNGSCPMASTDTTGVELNHAVVDEATGVIVKAHVPTSHGGQAIDAVLRGDVSGLTVTRIKAPVLTRPWHVRTHRDACLAADLAMLGKSRFNAGANAPALMVAPSASVHPSAIFDTDSGPICIDEHATVRPGAIIVGPAYVGPHATVLEHALIRAGTAIGPHCKVAGEVGGTIFQGYSNKAHDGYLGDAYVGEWVNLGAGTTNSNLLNTYGEIVARPIGLDGKPSSNERTGQQFLGCILGDHVKTAICTRIMTGSIIGTGTMFAATPALSGTVERFSWMTDSGTGSIATKTYRFDKFLEVATAAMARRKITPSAAYVDCLRALLASLHPSAPLPSRG